MGSVFHIMSQSAVLKLQFGKEMTMISGSLPYDIRVLAWCCTQKLFFYLIITDHNTMRVFCIFLLSIPCEAFSVYVKQGYW